MYHINFLAPFSNVKLFCMKKPPCGTLRKMYSPLSQAIIQWSLFEKMVKDQMTPTGFCNSFIKSLFSRRAFCAKIKRFIKINTKRNDRRGHMGRNEGRLQ